MAVSKAAMNLRASLATSAHARWIPDLEAPQRLRRDASASQRILAAFQASNPSSISAVMLLGVHRIASSTS